MQSLFEDQVVSSSGLDNTCIAARLDEVADLLEAQEANLHRVRAYRSAAQTVRNLQESVGRIIGREGLAGLLALPGIGQSLARSIEQLERTGRLGLLQRLRGESGAEHLFLTLPGIGPELASRIHQQLGIETSQELEMAAYDGRLARVAGMGPKRIRAIQESLQARFRRLPSFAPAAAPRPDVDRRVLIGELLDIDREYRDSAAARKLRCIAPRRFNPTGEAWLPVLHTHRGPRHYSALYSNTARAHELGTTHDWVVIYRDDHDGHGQWTAVTARYGTLRGRRVVRGLEPECTRYYAGVQSTLARRAVAEGKGILTVSTGQGALRKTCSATLPTSNLTRPVLP